MIFQKNFIIYDLPHALPTEVSEERVAFLDLETKAYGRKNSSIQYLGLLRKESDGWYAYQWIQESPGEELEILQQFLALLPSFDCLVHYNGTSFDLPILQKRCQHYELSLNLTALESLDLYRIFAPLKKFPGLPHLDQHSLEQFLNLSRANQTDNDLTMLPKLLSLCSYLDLVKGNFRIQDVFLKEDTLTVTALLNSSVPNNCSLHFAAGYLSVESNQLRVLIYGIHDTMKYFYPDYKNYYYLPQEDCAIHRSVASYVDKAHRVPAKAANCYTRKTGFFLPMTDDGLKPAFAKNYKDGQYYLLCDEKFLSDPFRISAYLLNCFRAL